MIKIYALILLILISGATRVAIASGQDGQCEQPAEHFINIENTRVRYVEAGAGPVVVLIHGNAGSVDDFDFQRLGRLCRNYRVMPSIDLGMGKAIDPGTQTLRYRIRRTCCMRHFLT